MANPVIGDLTVSGIALAVNLKLNNFTATTDPAVGNDDSEGYDSGSLWVNTTTNTLFACSDASTGAAVWQPASGPSTPPVLTGVGTPTFTSTSPTSAGQLYIDTAANAVYIADRVTPAPGDFYQIGAPAPVASVFTRTGAVAAQSGDYNAGQVSYAPGGNVYITGTDVQTGLNDAEANLTPVKTGAGNPTTTATSPDFVGQIYIDTSNNDAYIATQVTPNPSDFEQIDGAGGGVPVLSGAGTPTVTTTSPSALGQIYIDTTANDAYIAVALTPAPADFVQVNNTGGATLTSAEILTATGVNTLPALSVAVTNPALTSIEFGGVIHRTPGDYTVAGTAITWNGPPAIALGETVRFFHQ